MIAAVGIAVAVPPPVGMAPIAPPNGGLAIDGDLLANTPAGNIGDWIANTNLAPGAGQGVLLPNGTPIDPSRTFHFIDPYNDSSNDRIFSGGARRCIHEAEDLVPQCSLAGFAKGGEMG